MIDNCCGRSFGFLADLTLVSNVETQWDELGAKGAARLPRTAMMPGAYALG